MSLLPANNYGPSGPHITSGSLLSYGYQWTTSPSTGQAIGKIGFDGTSLFINVQDLDSLDISPLINTIVGGNTITVKGTSETHIYRISSITTTGSVYEFGATKLAGTTSFSNNENVSIAMMIIGNTGATGVQGYKTGIRYRIHSDVTESGTTFYNITEGSGSLQFQGTTYDGINFANSNIFTGDQILGIINGTDYFLAEATADAVGIGGDNTSVDVDIIVEEGTIDIGEIINIFILPKGATGATGVTGPSGPSPENLWFYYSGQGSATSTAGHYNAESSGTCSINYTDGNNANNSTLLSTLPIGSYIHIYQSPTAQQLLITTSVTDNSTYASYGVTVVFTTGTLNAAAYITIGIKGNTGETGPTGPTLDSYTATNSGHWATSPPTTFTSALDRLAAVASNNGGTPIP